MNTGWKDTFIDKYGRDKVVNGRLGCFSIIKSVLSFATGTKRHVSISVSISENGLTIVDVLGKKKYSPEDVIAISKKVAEIVADYERWGRE